MLERTTTECVPQLGGDITYRHRQTGTHIPCHTETINSVTLSQRKHKFKVSVLCVPDFGGRGRNAVCTTQHSFGGHWSGDTPSLLYWVHNGLYGDLKSPTACVLRIVFITLYWNVYFENYFRKLFLTKEERIQVSLSHRHNRLTKPKFSYYLWCN